MVKKITKITDKVPEKYHSYLNRVKNLYEKSLNF